MSSVFGKVIDWFKEVAEWVTENLGDPAIAQALREDLGLKPGESISQAKKGEIKGFADGLDPDQTAFLETVGQLKILGESLIALGDDLTDGDQTGWEVLYILMQVASAESVRLRAPWLYGTAKLLGIVTEDGSDVDRFLVDPIMDVLGGNGLPDTWYEELAAVFFDNLGFGAAILDQALGVDKIEVYAGWDTDPATLTPAADLASSDAVTFVVPMEISPGLTAQPSITLIPVGIDLGGPGVMWSLSGALEIEGTRGQTYVRAAINADAGLNLVHPLSKDASIATELSAGVSASAELSIMHGNKDVPSLLIGDTDGTRFELQTAALEMKANEDRVGIRFGIEHAKLVIALGQGDKFLSSLGGGSIEVDFGVVFEVDSQNGATIQGGTKARAQLPVQTSLYGIFTIQHLELALGPSSSGRDAALEITGAFGLRLGPVQMTVDRIGFALDVAVTEGNLIFFDADIGFRAPSALGLVIDVGIVKGGGFFRFEPDRGEYSGALELKIGPVNLSAVGILATERPDGSDGWSLLFLLYTKFPPVQLGFGFTLNGVGGLIGLHHSVSIDAIQSGLRTKALDNVLFPKNVVARAPTIINTLQTVFPISEGSLVIGPMIELGWGSPKIVSVRAGIIIALDNALGPGSVEFNSFVVVGQLEISLGKFKKKSLLKLLVDFLGYYDVERKRVGFIAQLRDSHVAMITLTGTFIVQADFGEQSSFVLSAGGFHPKFKDIPDGVPAKIDRIGAKFPISFVKITLQGYFAVTPATVQIGASVRAVAKVGPVKIDGWLSFDALFEFEPRFHFTVDLKAGVSVKFKGRSLSSVQLEMTLTGPGRWEASGKVSFSVAWWDITKRFDVATGSVPLEPATSTDVAALVQAALSDKGNWSAQLPIGAESLVSLGEISGHLGLLAHPLGTLSVLQNVAPLDLTLERFGRSSVQGPDRFSIKSVSIGGQPLPVRGPIHQQFARSQFVDMSAGDRLTKPSFESFPAGVQVGSDEYSFPTGEEVAAELDYETFTLVPDVEPDRSSVIKRPEIRGTVRASDLAWQAKLGSVARSGLSPVASLRSADISVTVSEPPLAVASTTDLSLEVALVGAAAATTAGAAQSLASLDRSDVQIVEEFEVRGG